MLLRRSLNARQQFSVLHQSLRCSYATSTANSNFKYAIQGEDNIVRSTINKHIPTDCSLFDFLTANFHRNPEKVALIDGITGQQCTFGNLDVLSRKFGSVLVKNGFGVQDTLALFAPNTMNYAPVLLGTLGVGGCVSTVNPQYTKRELVNQILDSKSKLIVTTHDLLETAKAAAHECGVKQIILLEDGNGSKQHGIVRWAEVDDDSADAFENNSKQINPLHDCAMLPYSSGTTGKPKGVMLTHHNLISNLIQFGNFFENISRDVGLGLLPFFHIYGLTTIVFSGMERIKTTVILPKFEPHSFLQAIQDHKVDFANLVPPLLLFLIKSPDVANYDITGLKVVTTGAAPFGSDLWKSFEDKYSANIQIIQGYGLTEVSPVATMTPGDDVRTASVGQIVPNSEIKIVHTASGEILGANEVGEVAIKGPHVMKGYLNNPKATAECISDDGWFYSGDIGYYDEENHFFIVDRLKELIKYKGFQVPPAELEDLLMSHPEVADAAVIGIPDEAAGELPKAFVVPKGDVTAEELINYVELSVAPFKRLRGGLEFIDAIPKAASGKILRRNLREK